MLHRWRESGASEAPVLAAQRRTPEESEVEEDAKHLNDFCLHDWEFQGTEEIELAARF